MRDKVSRLFRWAIDQILGEVFLGVLGWIIRYILPIVLGIILPRIETIRQELPPMNSWIAFILFAMATFGGINFLWIGGSHLYRFIKKSTISERSLINKLRDYSSDYANVKILFANVKHRELADTLISIFDLAGWQTNINNVPLDTWRHEYIKGIEVLGYNKHLVEAVATLLTKSGWYDVRAIVNNNKIKPSNPKYRWVQESIKITIGHNE